MIGHPGKPKLPGAELLSGQIGGPLPTFGGVGTLPFGRAWDPVARKAKPAAHLTWENWMLEYAQMVREENTKFVSIRQGNIGQVQVGLNVEENDDDCYEWVEEEYTDDEEVDPAAAAVKPEPTPASIGPDGSTPMRFDSATPAATPAPTELPPLASTSSGGALSALPAAPSPGVAPTPPPPRPKKRRMVRSYVPIRGLYEPETNVPHVYRATQARRVLGFERASKVPRLESGTDADQTASVAGANGAQVQRAGDAAEEARRRTAAVRAGVASVEVVSDERSWSLETGGRSVDDAIASRGGREDPIPGMWDFLAIAKEEGIVL